MLPAALIISGCSPGHPADASCNLDAKDLPKLLQATGALIEKGFGDREMQVVEGIAESMPVRSTRARTFPIITKGKGVTLRIEMKKDDADEIEIWFITEPELTREILQKMHEMLR